MGAAKRTAVLAIATVVGFAAPITLYAAGSRYFEPVAAADAMPPYEILTRVRTLALDPIGEPVRRGPYYILHAYDRRGAEVRVVADAAFGDVLSVTPARLVLPGPGTVGGARIIHVPLPGEETAAVAPDDGANSEAALPEAPAAPRRPAAKPRETARPVVKREPDMRRRPFQSAPPPAERRAVLTAPSPASGDGPTPIRPTPRFGAGETGTTTVIIPPAPPSATASAAPAVAPVPPPPTQD